MLKEYLLNFGFTEKDYEKYYKYSKIIFIKE